MRPEAVVKVEPPRVVVSVDVAVVLAGEVCWVQDICGVVLHVDDAAGPIALLLRASGGGKGREGGVSRRKATARTFPKFNVTRWTHLRIGKRADSDSNLDPIGSISSRIVQICFGSNI